MRDALLEAQGRGERIETRVTVIGIGQSLRGDDAAGIEAVKAWRTTNPSSASRQDVRVETLEVPGLGLLDLLEGAEAAIIVDAVETSGAPGTVSQVAPTQLEAFEAGAKSAHGWGVAETLRIGRKLDARLAALDVRVIGIAGREFGVGCPMSPEVREALPRASIAIEEQVREALNSRGE